MLKNLINLIIAIIKMCITINEVLFNIYYLKCLYLLNIIVTINIFSWMYHAHYGKYCWRTIRLIRWWWIFKRVEKCSEKRNGSTYGNTWPWKQTSTPQIAKNTFFNHSGRGNYAKIMIHIIVLEFLFPKILKNKHYSINYL